MTELDLICADPLSIGMMGTIGFFGLALGSLLFNNTIDTYGRKKVIVIHALVTPVGLLCILFFVRTLETIYAAIFIMGMTYTTRNSTAYSYCTEFLEHAHRIKVGQYNFMFLGIFQAVAGLWFYLIKDQNQYFIFKISILTVAISWVVFAVPESPVWLYEKRMFPQLEKCLTRVAQINNVENIKEKVDACMEGL